MTTKEKLVRVLYKPCKNPKHLAEECKIIALAYLKMKVKSGNSFITNLGASIDDLALDCIADLFERNEMGRYPQFEAYFSGINPTELSEPESRSKLRRLVFSKVNDGLFRNFGIYDMSLSKIIRNLKLSADNYGLPIQRIDGDNYLIFEKEAQTSSKLPIMPPEFLEIKLTNSLELRMETPDVLSVLIDIFRDQTDYEKKYSIVQLARIIRRSFIHLQDHPKTNTGIQESVISKYKLNKLLGDAIEGCSECFEKTYIHKGKLDRETLEKYLSCIKKILHHHYVADSDTGDSYYDHFKLEFPEISKEEYRDCHRQYLEYMVKKVRSDLFYKVKRVI